MRNQLMPSLARATFHAILYARVPPRREPRERHEKQSYGDWY